jgi:murein DD-endopeptidase MepM/ murein hydrolase activator NlpD
MRDVRRVFAHLRPRDRYIFNLGSIGLLRPDLSLPAYAGLAPADGVCAIYNFFDRSSGGIRWRGAVTRDHQRDWRGGRLSYDEHDGTDFVCPPGTPVVAAAPGIVAALRDDWLRGGLTASVDHGAGVVTQYTHLAKLVAEIGEPVQRGQIIAWSGVSGIDIAQFFPWVPPHLHFMAWVDGRPVDPYLAPGESPRPGTWSRRSEPRTTRGPLEGDRSPSSLDLRVDRRAIDRLVPHCLDPRIRAELEDAPDDVARAAILEDSLHHESIAWPESAHFTRVRLSGAAEDVALTLPLTSELYASAKPADTPFTGPPTERGR